eukprot:5985623-Amphidinium_carterae.2
MAVHLLPQHISKFGCSKLAGEALAWLLVVPLMLLGPTIVAVLLAEVLCWTGRLPSGVAAYAQLVVLKL